MGWVLSLGADGNSWPEAAVGRRQLQEEEGVGGSGGGRRSRSRSCRRKEEGCQPSFGVAAFSPKNGGTSFQVWNEVQIATRLRRWEAVVVSRAVDVGETWDGC